MFCMRDLTKELKQPPVVILKQVIFYKIFILWLWVKSIKRYSQDVQFMNFPSHVFFNDINHCYNAAILKKNSLWLLLFYIALATYYYSEKEHRALRSAIVSYLLKLIIAMAYCCQSFNLVSILFYENIFLCFLALFLKSIKTINIKIVTLP